MKSFGKIAAILLLSSIVVVACKKEDDDDTPTTSSKTKLLTAHEWVWSNIKADAPFDTVDIWGSFPTCEKDDVISFMTNKKGTLDEGFSKCEPTDPQTSSFDWTWLQGETNLRIIDDMDTTTFTQVSLTETMMSGKVLYYTDPLLGDIYATFTFSKK